MSTTTPAHMQALLLDAHREDVLDAVRSLRVVQRPTPKPGHGQVLVKMNASPCNPSDLLFLQGKYGTRKTLPTVPGWEGSGTVVASGGGLLAWWLQGKRVACGNQDDCDGAWAQYMVANAAECIPLQRGLSLDQGATLIINPLTAVGLLATARKEGNAAAVQTAGASQVGRMIVRLAKEAGYPLISIVRRDAQVELLKKEGAVHVLNSSDPGFEEQLTATCAKLQATAAFEAVAGDMTGIVLNAMPRGATAYVYGSLSETACGGVEPLGLVFEEKRLRGFYLGDWLKQQGSLGILRAAGRVQRMVLKGQIGTHVERRVGLEGAVAALEHYVQHMTDGKVLIAPQD